MRLAQHTGDTLIVTDPDAENPVVILPFDKYEDLVAAPDYFEDLALDETGEEWHEDLPEEFFMEEDQPLSATSSESADLEELGVSRVSGVPVVQDEFSPEVPAEQTIIEEMPVMQPIPEQAEETVPIMQGEQVPSKNVVEGDEGSEEKFYLEPIE